jgi:hypothetical protein
LRANAKIRYVGKFEGAASAPAAPPEPAPVMPGAASAPGALSPADISKGMGLK